MVDAAGNRKLASAHLIHLTERFLPELHRRRETFV